MASSLQRFTLRLLLPLLVCGSAHADLKIRPKDKIKETPRDFQKENEKFGFPTPEPQKVEAAFVSGGSVEIVLEASTRYLGTVEFEIREKPKHGTLGPMRIRSAKENNKVLVTYTHNGDGANLADSFTFVARIGEGSTSVPATVTLRGRPSLPRLEVVQHPRFKKLSPGEEDLGRAVILNSGTAIFDGLITWTPPFLGPPKLVIPPGGKQEIIIRVRPAAPGSYKLASVLQAGVTESMLKGTVDCVLPYVISPGTLELTFDAASGQRKGVTRVTNASAQPMSLRIDAGQRVQTQAELNLQPQESQELLITLAPDDVAAFRGEVSVYQETHREKLFVNAAPEPAQLKLMLPESGRLDFGTLQKGSKAERTIRIANVGGEELILNMADSPPFKVSKDKAFRIPPSASEEFVVIFETDQGGKYDKTLSISGNGGTVNLGVLAVLNDPRRSGVMPKGPGIENPHLDRAPSRVRQPGPERPSGANVPAPAPSVTVPVTISKPPPAPVSAPVQPTPEPRAPDAPKTGAAVAMAKASALQKQVMAYAAAIGVGPGDQPGNRSPTLTPIPEIGVLEAGREHLVLGWKNPDVEPARFEVEKAVQMLGKDTGVPVKTWTSVKSWTPAPAPDGASAARIEGLEPGARYEFRVAGVDADGKYSKASSIVMVSTLPPFRMPLWLWVLTGGLVAMALLMIYRQRLSSI